MDTEIAEFVAAIAFGAEVRSRNGMLELHLPAASSVGLEELRGKQIDSLVRRLMKARTVRAYSAPDFGGEGRPKGEPAWPPFGVAIIRSGNHAREFPVTAGIEFIALTAAVHAFLFKPANSVNEWRSAAAHPLLESAFEASGATDTVPDVSDRFRAFGAAMWAEL